MSESYCIERMVSRRKILSQSRDELSFELKLEEQEDDVWFTKEKLFKDHIQEVLDKWESIDDEIWAKVVVLERNRRVAKACTMFKMSSRVNLIEGELNICSQI